MTDELYPERTIDETLDLVTRVEREGQAPFSGPKLFELAKWQEGKCHLSILYEVSVTLHKTIEGARGRTIWSGAELRTGPLWGQNEELSFGQIGCFAAVVIRVEIQLDLSNRGDKWREDNEVVRKEREDARPPGRTSFDDLPLEFILLHEQMHVADFAAAIAEDARKALRCVGTDVEALDRELKAKWDQLVETSGHGDDDSPGEESVRRRVWEEWDRRHP